jgi:hypothetical protein
MLSRTPVYIPALSIPLFQPMANRPGVVSSGPRTAAAFRSAGLRLSGIGRLVAALAQCAHFFASYVDVDEELSRSRATETVELISTLGLIQASHQTGDVVFAPRALFVRISRILDGVADLTAAADLSRALREDALIARAGSKTHRF